MAEVLHGVLHGRQAAEQYEEQADLSFGVLKVGQLKVIAQNIQSATVGAFRDRATMGPSTNLAATSGGDSAETTQDTPPLSVEMNERGLVIRVLESTLFELGSADIKPEARQTLDLIATQLVEVPNQIRIEGHTDNLPISTARFPSNWELSTARASSVVRYLITNHGLPPDQVSALGFGEYRPLVPNDTPQNRARNRRVDIVILTDNLSRYEPQAAIPDEATVTRNNLQQSLEDNSGG